MEFKFDNYSRHVGSRGQYDWFEWKVFVNEPDHKLDQISEIEYRLHETFPNPIRVVRDRKAQFALESSGWGEFTIFITIRLNNGEEVRTKYYLDLGKPWPSRR